MKTASRHRNRTYNPVISREAAYNAIFLSGIFLDHFLHIRHHFLNFFNLRS